MKPVVNDTKSAKIFFEENRSWQSEIGSWEIDLLFCSRMLDIYGLKVENSLMSDTQRSLKSEIEGLKTSKFSQMKSQLKFNELKLSRLVEDSVLIKDRQMSFRQDDDRSEMNALRLLVHQLQQHLYSFIDQMKSL
jgi:hypothetical protein